MATKYSKEDYRARLHLANNRFSHYTLLKRERYLFGLIRIFKTVNEYKEGYDYGAWYSLKFVSKAEAMDYAILDMKKETRVKKSRIDISLWD